MSETIRILLGSEVIGVTGSVNGVNVNFTLTSPQVWTTETNKATDGKYVLDIYTERSTGITDNYKLTVYQFYGWTPPVYDRLQWDVDNGTDKGFMNYHDLNRIETNCKFLAEVLIGYGYPVVVVTKTDWKRTDFPYLSELERIAGNIQLLKDNFYALPTTPALPDNLEVMYYYKLNDIEKILFDLNSVIDLMIKSFRYCGTFYAGGEHYGIGGN